MFSEDKLNDLKGAEKYSNSFIRHRIPYRLLGRRALSAKRLVVSSKVLFPAIPTRNCDVILTFPSTTEDETLMWLLARIKTRAPNLRVQVRHHSHTGIYCFYLTSLYESLLQGAEELGILKPLKSDYGGGMKEFVYEDQDCFAGIEEEASFLNSQERQSIVLHFLNELRATGDDSLKGITFIEGQPIVPLLITKNIISQVFPLHNHADLTTLRKKWVQAFFSRQPLDLVCQYFGVKIGLYFAYLGHYTTWLLLPAILGLIIFLYQGDNQFVDDVSFVGFALFNTVWSSLYLKFWSRSSTSHCYEWGTLQKKDELLKDPRPLFEGNKRKSPITGQPELVYPSWKRLLFLHCVTVPIVALCLLFVFVTMLLCFELQEWVNSLIDEEELPYIFSFVPKVLLAVLVSIFDEVYKQLAIWLTNKENYRLEESHETGLILKLVLFQFVNSFLSLFYIGFYLRDMDRLRDQLAALLITRQVLGNLKEALMPYIVWKARLYSVGYKLATRMSPASLDKEVERMAQQAKAKTFKRKEKSSKSGGKNSGTDEEEEHDESIPTLTQAEAEGEMKKYESTLEDYLEMVIQFGYVTLFSSAFPLAALCALVNNVIEIRSDAFKLCITHQRPFGQQVDSIGIWQDVLWLMSVLAVTVNCALIATSGLLARFFPDLSSAVYCLLFIAVEHTLITGKFVLYRCIPDFPQTVATQMAKLEYQRTEALKKLLISQAATNQSAGSPISSVPVSPVQRRRRMADQEGNDGHASTSNSAMGTVGTITPSNTAQRPSDFYTPPQTPLVRGRMDDFMRPVPPVRKSLLKNDSSNKTQSSAPDALAESILAAAMHPVLDSRSSSSSLKDSTTTVAFSPASSLTGKSTLGSSSLNTSNRGHQSEILKRVYRRRLDQESWRRRSEPVASAIQQAVKLNQAYQTSVTDDVGIGEPIKHTRSLSLREEIRRSKEKMHSLDKDRYKLGSDNSSVIHAAHNIPNLSSMPPPSASTGLKYCGSPRLMSGSPRVGRVLSRKSRSFSSTDVTDAKQTFRDRLSWKGELSIVNRSNTKDGKEEDRLLQDSPVGVEEPKPESRPLQNKDGSPSQAAGTDDQPLKSEKENNSTEGSGHAQGAMRASRESRAKPLSISVNTSPSSK